MEGGEREIIYLSWGEREIIYLSWGEREIIYLSWGGEGDYIPIATISPPE